MRQFTVSALVEGYRIDEQITAVSIHHAIKLMQAKYSNARNIYVLHQEINMNVPTYDFPQSPILIIGFFGIFTALAVLYVANRDYFGSPYNEDKRNDQTVYYHR